MNPSAAMQTPPAVSFDFGPFLDPLRPTIAEPFAAEGGTVATNGHILIWMSEPCERAAPEIAGGKLGNVITSAILAATEGSGTWLPVSDITFDAPACGHCRGGGRVEKTPCYDCDGEGSFYHGRHDYECQSCDGEGAFYEPTSRVDAETLCASCLGTGVCSHSPSSLRAERSGAPVTVAARYVKLLQLRMPDAFIGSGLVDDVFFPIKFAGGCGAIMPARVS